MSTWIKVRSWHLVSGVVSRGGMIATLCGRWVEPGALKLPDPAPNERTCETCFRAQERRKADA